MPNNLHPIIGEEINISEDQLKEIVYFILMKFQVDIGHMQGTASKRDLLGGYIERWVNKVAETVIFDELLKTKEYEVVPDYFLYGNDSIKNAPDIIGLKLDNQLIPFVRYKDGKWETVDNRPRIEVKTIRKDQYLFGIRETQLIDDYYVFIESNLNQDFLAILFADSVFDKKYFNSLKTYNDFIKSDISKQLIKHVEYKKPKNIGTFKLLGIFLKDDLIKGTTKCGKKVDPWYFSNVEPGPDNKKTKPKLEKVLLNKGMFQYKYEGITYVPVHITGDGVKSGFVSLVEKNKSTTYAVFEKPVIINGNNIVPGIVKIIFKKFERSSSWVEHICTKDIMHIVLQDATNNLISVLDKIVKQ